MTPSFDTVYSATRPSPAVTIGAGRYRGVRFAERLVRCGAQHFEVVEEDHVGGRVRVTTMERTLVDVMRSPHLAGDWDEIWRTMALADDYDLTKVSAYCDLVDAGPELRSKIGFFLDHHRDLWGFSDTQLAPFRSPDPNEPYRLDPYDPRQGVFVSGWNLVVPNYVWEGGWEEVY